MPFEIVRNDIVNMQVDAIVNTANPRPEVGYGVDMAIHKKAGPMLLQVRKLVGNIAVGDVAVTPAFDLPAQFVIHAVGPVWKDGTQNEEALLRQCYDKALMTAWKSKCESIAFPLISTGNYGFPKDKALQIAISAFSSFLMEHDMQIYLVVFKKDAFELSEKLFQRVKSYIDENYIRDKLLDEYEILKGEDLRSALRLRNRREFRCREEFLANEEDLPDFSDINAGAFPLPGQTTVGSQVLPSAKPSMAPQMPQPAMVREESSTYQTMDLETLLAETDAGFSETLLKMIDETGKKDSQIYKKANVDRKLFSKIRNNPGYKPSKPTALALAIALELNLDETRDLIARAGYALTHSSKFDIIVEYFILQENYDIFELNEVLFAFDQPLIGG